MTEQQNSNSSTTPSREERTPDQLLDSPEVTPDTLDQLFSKDPEEISDEEIMALCKVMRERRALWERDEAAKASSGRRATRKKAGITSEALKEMSLDDIMEDE